MSKGNPGGIDVVLPDDPRPVDDDFIGHVFQTPRGFKAFRPGPRYLAAFPTLAQAKKALAKLHSAERIGGSR